MATTGTDLVRVSVQTPDRRVDVALPERVPVATLLPALLAAGGEELADRGALHAGWVLRRVSGRAFDTGQGLVDQGVRDGDVLCLGFADENWPELDYDDAVEAMLVARNLAAHAEVEQARVARIFSAFREMIGWTAGRFSFDPGVPLAAAPAVALSARTILMQIYEEQDDQGW